MSLRAFLRRSLFRSAAAPQANQLPSPTFFCAAPYFLPILPPNPGTTANSSTPFSPLGLPRINFLNLRRRQFSTSISPSQQLQSEALLTSPLPPPISINTTPHAQLQPLTVLLPLLKLQPSHYITIHINSFPFLVTPGDVLTLPFRLPDVTVGDVLRLTHASILGSRDYTVKGSPYVDENLFELRARVVEVTSEPMRIKIKKKQRNRRKKTVKSKHVYTVLKIGNLVIKDAPAEGAVKTEVGEVGDVGKVEEATAA